MAGSEGKQVSESGKVVLRNAELEDLPGILRVEKAAFTSPWTETAFRNELVLNEFAAYIVIELDAVIIGYAGIWLILDEGHITNIAIHPEQQGNHYGELLLRELMQQAEKAGVTHMTLEVRVSNQKAQNLYKKLHFEPGAIRKNYYPDNHENALVMWVDL